MKTVFLTVGLPASGKTTWAKEMVAANAGAYKRISKDDLRGMLDGGKWSSDNEQFVLLVRDSIIVDALRRGKHVIVDDTNLHHKHQQRVAELAHSNGARFEVVDFRHVHVDACIERDRKRPNYVGEVVIRRMWRDFIAPKPPVVERDSTLPDCVICDIDGTLAILNGRGPYEGEKCDTDLPHKPVVDLVKHLLRGGEQIIFVSGRFEAVREKTIAWLDQYVTPIRLPLFMRPDGDTRKDAIIKAEIYEREIKGKYNVKFILDDRNRVVEGWRALGLTVFQVAEGDF